MSETSVSVSNRQGKPRPLSPHLQVYKLPVPAILSITHRATGVALTAGLLLFSWWIIALACGIEAFDQVQGIIGSIPGQIVLAGWTWALFYHLANGIRHLFWDAGYGFEISATYRSGWLVLAVSTLATAALWAILLGALR